MRSPPAENKPACWQRPDSARFDSSFPVPSGRLTSASFLFFSLPIIGFAFGWGWGFVKISARAAFCRPGGFVAVSADGKRRITDKKKEAGHV
jgi:hypothetical protein